jgi:hypothetical protein
MGDDKGGCKQARACSRGADSACFCSGRTYTMHPHLHPQLHPHACYAPHSRPHALAPPPPPHLRQVLRVDEAEAIHLVLLHPPVQRGGDQGAHHWLAWRGGDRVAGL